MNAARSSPDPARRSRPPRPARRGAGAPCVTADGGSVAGEGAVPPSGPSPPSNPRAVSTASAAHVARGCTAASANATRPATPGNPSGRERRGARARAVAAHPETPEAPRTSDEVRWARPSAGAILGESSIYDFEARAKPGEEKRGATRASFPRKSRYARSQRRALGFPRPRAGSEVVLLALDARVSALDMPLPSDAARVSLAGGVLGGEDESSDVHEISAPEGWRTALAHAPDAELDALVRALRSKKPGDRAKLEAEEREAARARVRVELMSHVHRLNRDGVVSPRGFDAAARPAAEARRGRRAFRSIGEGVDDGRDTNRER